MAKTLALSVISSLFARLRLAGSSSWFITWFSISGTTALGITWSASASCPEYSPFAVVADSPKRPCRKQIASNGSLEEIYDLFGICITNYCFDHKLPHVSI